MTITCCRAQHEQPGRGIFLISCEFFPTSSGRFVDQMLRDFASCPPSGDDVDVPVSTHRAFVFANCRHRIGTLRQLGSELERIPARLFEGYVVRRDFLRWIADAFRDQALAEELLDVERRHRAGSRGHTLPEMASAARGMYDLIGDELETV